MYATKWSCVWGKRCITFPLTTGRPADPDSWWEQLFRFPRSILNELWFWENTSVPGSCSHVVSSLHYRALTWSVDATVNCVQTMISGMFHNRIIPVFNAGVPEGPKIMSIKYGFWGGLSLVHRDFFRFLESFDDIICCRWWDIISLYRFILKIIIHSRHSCLQIDDPLPIFTSEKPCLSKMHFNTRSCYWTVDS